MSDSFKDNLSQLMDQAKQMQDKMQKAQSDLGDLAIVGEGGGLVKIEMNGRYDVKKVAIDPSIIDADQQDFLEDLVAAAINDAVRKVETASRDKMMSLTSDLKLPEDFKMPFGDGGEK